MMYEPTGNLSTVALSSPWMSDSDQEVLWTFIDCAPVAVLAADDDRRILRVNARWCDLTGYEASAAAGSRRGSAPTPRAGVAAAGSDGNDDDRGSRATRNLTGDGAHARAQRDEQARRANPRTSHRGRDERRRDPRLTQVLRVAREFNQ